MSNGQGYPDPWRPGGKFIESGLEPVCDIHLEESAKDEPEHEDS